MAFIYRARLTMIPDLTSYDHIIVGYSGGKDSLASVLFILGQLDVDPARIELWHQHVDGEPGSAGLMDWPVTEAYVRATGEMLGLTVRFQWREGGFEREMLRDGVLTAPVHFERDDSVERLDTKQGKPDTRLRFPQVSSDLRVRWCSAYLKIDVAARAINNDPRFIGKRTLFVTGERRQESAARAKHEEIEPHRCHCSKRHVDHWRPVIDWTEEQVWNVIRRHGIRPHPAYYLGFGRVSCMKCIFGLANQWATVRELDPTGFKKIHEYERRFGCTIKQGESVEDQANRGQSTIPDTDEGRFNRTLALGREYPSDFVRVSPDEWVMPTGAFKHCGGPT